MVLIDISNLNKDWTGNRNSIYKTLGASNHCDGERERNDYYATEPKATKCLLDVEKFNSPYIWGCACGEGYISTVLKAAGYNVYSSDIVNRGYGAVRDFLSASPEHLLNCDIVTNPPYKYAKEFIEHALALVKNGCKVAMLLKLQFLEGKSRKEFFLKNPPARIYVFSSRIKCAKNGDFDSIGSSAIAYAWYIWEKGYSGKTVIEWIN